MFKHILFSFICESDFNIIVGNRIFWILESRGFPKSPLQDMIRLVCHAFELVVCVRASVCPCVRARTLAAWTVFLANKLAKNGFHKSDAEVLIPTVQNIC